MRKFKTALLLIMFHSALFSQEIDFNFDSKEIQDIINGTIYIIPTGNKVFDDSLKIAVEQYWKVSRFKVLLKEEVNNYLKDENNYFLAPLNTLTNDGLNSNARVVDPLSDDAARTIYIFHGGKNSKMTNIEYQTSSIDCDLIFWLKENAAKGLGYVIKNLNDNIEVVHSKKLKSNNNLSIRWNPVVGQELSKNANILKTKILLVDKNSSFYLSEKILKTYKYEYKIANISEIIYLLYADPKKYCFLSDHVIYSGLIDIYYAETKSLIYTTGRSKGGSSKVSAKQIAALNAAIEKK
ncbi:MAG: hypothetical protein ACT4ON_15840 [Bacteroidota bacterium]